MKNKFAAVFLAVLLAVMNISVLAEQESMTVVPYGWKSVWNEECGVVFAVPADMAEWTVDKQDAEDGLLWRGSNADMTVQLKVYGEDALSYAQFIDMLDEYEYTVTDVRNVGDTEITVYANPVPGENMQLCGAVLTGTDGRLCKISVFNGDNDEYSEDAAVWELADMFMQTVQVRKFFGWNIYRQRTY